MGVVSAKELPRTFEREVGRAAILKRRWVCVLDDNTTINSPSTEAQCLAAALGITEAQAIAGPVFGLAHPTTGWKLRKFAINEGYEGSPYHVEVVAEYGIVRDEELLSPGDRPTKFSVDGALGEYPALYFYDGGGNGTIRPLTNSAYDFYPGLMTTEGLQKITISKNFVIPPPPSTNPSYPSSWAQALNHVNSDTYWGCPPGTLKIEDFDATEEYEESGGSIVKYWKASVIVSYRQSGHQFQLPDVGYNHISGGQKQRAMVFDFNNSEWIPSPTPIALNGSGALSPTGYPAILNRRVNPEIGFQSLFGTPPA